MPPGAAGYVTAVTTSDEVARPGPRRARLARWVLLALFIAGMAAQFHTGLADNGDFTRSVKFFTAGPVGIRPNFPPLRTELWHRRFYEYWVPDWTVRWHAYEKVITSAALLWLPGVLVASAAGASSVSLPWLSLVPRLLLLGQLWLVLRWAGGHPARRWLPWTLGAPLVLLFTGTSNAAYLNSFYQEAALQTFILPVVCSLVALRARADRARLGLVVLAVAVLATAKSSALYWPLLALPFAAWAWTHGGGRPDRWRTHGGRLVAGGLAVALGLTALSRTVTSYREANVNPYHSLFYGALMFSRDPAAHLRRLDLEDGLDCVGVSAYQPRGKAFFDAHRDQQRFSNVLTTLAHEPFIAWRLGRFGLTQMQDDSLEYLGKFSRDDPRRGPDGPPWPPVRRGSETRLWEAAAETTGLNLWAALKFHVFPTGLPLAATLLVFAGFFGWRLRFADGARDLAFVGLLCTLAVGADLAVALLGDGRHELIKHLYFANLLFDLALIAFVNAAAVCAWEAIRTGRASGRSSPRS